MSKIREIDAQIEQVRKETENLKEQISFLNRELTKRQTMLRELAQKLKRAKERMSTDFGLGIGVSDHALVRYCERVLNIDMKSIRRQMVPEETAALIKSAGGTGVFPVGPAKLKVEGHVVVTITVGN